MPFTNPHLVAPLGLLSATLILGTESHFDLPPALSAPKSLRQKSGILACDIQGDSSELIFDWGTLGSRVKYFVGVNDGETRQQYFESNDRVFSQSSEIAYIARSIAS